ncbi:unnamed protein product [Caenorhabditis brenneri]
MSLSRPANFPFLKLPWLCIKCVIQNSDLFDMQYVDYWGGQYLLSYTSGDKLDALKIGIEFMIDVFKCSVKRVFVDGHKLSELFGLGINSVGKLHVRDPGPVVITDLKNLLKTIEVTDSFVFDVQIPKDYFCDRQIFKCRQVLFDGVHSADLVTFEILGQLDVPQLSFWFHRFSVEDIVSYITHWFNSNNRKLEHVHFEFDNPVSLENIKIDHLNPMLFDEKRRNRCPLVGEWKGKDMSSGMDILRQDGLLATFFVDSTSVIFYVWHKRFPNAV